MREIGGPAMLNIVYLVAFAVLALGLTRRYTFPAAAVLGLGALMMSVNGWYLFAHVWLYGGIDWGEVWPMLAAMAGSAVIVLGVARRVASGGAGTDGRITRRLFYVAGGGLMVPVAPQMAFFFPGAIFFVPLGLALLLFMAVFNPPLRQEAAPAQ